MSNLQRHFGRSSTYRLRMMAALIVVFILLIGVVRLWPVQESGPVNIAENVDREAVTVQNVQQTRQGSDKPPPPPEPQGPPIEVPDDEIIDEEPIDLDISFAPGDSESDGAPGQGPPGTPGGGAVEGQPPRPMRFVEPRYPSAARRNNIRARIKVRVLVNEQGQVQEREIVERVIMNGTNGKGKPVEHVGYGLEEAALTAVEEWRFEPGRKGGKPVSSYTTVTLSFGV